MKLLKKWVIHRQFWDAKVRMPKGLVDSLETNLGGVIVNIARKELPSAEYPKHSIVFVKPSSVVTLYKLEKKVNHISKEVKEKLLLFTNNLIKEHIDIALSDRKKIITNKATDGETKVCICDKCLKGINTHYTSEQLRTAGLSVGTISDITDLILKKRKAEGRENSPGYIDEINKEVIDRLEQRGLKV